MTQPWDAATRRVMRELDSVTGSLSSNAIRSARTLTLSLHYLNELRGEEEGTDTIQRIFESVGVDNTIAATFVRAYMEKKMEDDGLDPKADTPSDDNFHTTSCYADGLQVGLLWGMSLAAAGVEPPEEVVDQ